MSDLIRIYFDHRCNLNFIISNWIYFIIIAYAIIRIMVLFIRRRKLFSSIEFDSAEFGIQGPKIKVKPNNENIRIAYQLWVELNTRKIGLPLDFENDVIVEVYNSWYDFFNITRELIKEMPVSKIRNDKNSIVVIELATKILNELMRPHLTYWQARFRRWYEQFIKDAKFPYLSPQESQKVYPDYEKLISDMSYVNFKLIHYKEKLYELSFGKKQ